MEYEGLEYQGEDLEVSSEALEYQEPKQRVGDDPTTFDGKQLNVEVPIADSDVVPSTEVEIGAGVSKLTAIYTKYPSDIIDCDGLTIPGTRAGDLHCGTIYRANIYGTVKHGKETKFFAYDVGHAVFGTPNANRSLCIDPSVGDDVIDQITYHFFPSRPAMRLAAIEQQLVTALVIAKVDGRDVYKILQGTVLELSPGQKFIRQPDGSWLFNKQPVSLQSLLEALCQPSE